jgi:hypothetical protein
VDPLYLLAKEVQEGRIPEKIFQKVRDRLEYLTDSVQRVERASGIKYPTYYISPYLTLMKSRTEFGELGVLFARVIPSTSTGKLLILVEFSSALILLAAKGTIQAVVAHELTHYVNLVRKITRMDLLSETESTTLFESGYLDEERTFDPKYLFKERSIVSLLKRKFSPNLMDERLIKKVQKEWVSKNYPVRVIAPEENVVRLSSEVIANSAFDPKLISMIKEMEEKAGI